VATQRRRGGRVQQHRSASVVRACTGAKQAGLSLALRRARVSDDDRQRWIYTHAPSSHRERARQGRAALRRRKRAAVARAAYAVRLSERAAAEREGPA
jgi:hypothetical protein